MGTAQGGPPPPEQQPVPAPGTGDPELTCSFVLPARLAAAWASRSRVRAWLSSWSLSGELVEDVVYMTSEAVSNSAEHAYRPDGSDELIAVRASIRPEASGGQAEDVRIEVSVRDFGRWRPIAPDPAHRGHGLAAIASRAVELTIRRHQVGPDSGTEVVLLSERTRLPAAALAAARMRPRPA